MSPGPDAPVVRGGHELRFNWGVAWHPAGGGKAVDLSGHTTTARLTVPVQAGSEGSLRMRVVGNVKMHGGHGAVARAALQREDRGGTEGRDGRRAAGALDDRLRSAIPARGQRPSGDASNASPAWV